MRGVAHSSTGCQQPFQTLRQLHPGQLSATEIEDRGSATLEDIRRSQHIGKAAHARSVPCVSHFIAAISHQPSPPCAPLASAWYEHIGVQRIESVVDLLLERKKKERTQSMGTCKQRSAMLPISSSGLTLSPVPVFGFASAIFVHFQHNRTYSVIWRE